jgi:hypothetical protein
MERPLSGEERTYLTTVGMSACSQRQTFAAYQATLQIAARCRSWEPSTASKADITEVYYSKEMF